MSENQEPHQNHQFIKYYKCLPLVNRGKKNVERGGKLLLPVSALDELESLEIPYPLLFKVTNEDNQHFTHAGVFEFTSKEGHASLPRWLMTHLGLKTGNQVKIESISLPSATYCKLQPLTRNFAYISDAKFVLEQNLKYFACLTEGDIIFVHEMNKNQVYKARVMETKPEGAVNILDCEMELDLEIPEKPKREAINKVKPEKEDTNANPRSEFKPFQGKGYRLSGESKTATVNQMTKGGKEVLNSKGSGKTYSAKKRKNEGCDKNEPEAKKKCNENDTEEIVNQLMIVRQKQQEFYERQKENSFAPFDGAGHSLKKE